MSLLSDLFPVIFAVIGVAVVVVFVVVIVLIVRNARRVRERGHDPLTLQADLATRLLDSEALRPDTPLTERLAELDRLRDARTITPQEYEAARASVLGGR